MGHSIDGDRHGEVVAWRPAIDLVEEKAAFVIKADLPGLEKKDINVNIEGNVLSLSGSRQSEHEEKEEGELTVYRSERYVGNFYRSFELPAEVDASGVKAAFKNGVLTVTIPKREDAQPKKIDIKVS
jgi:HSP20 family protein